jgi:hypothetical protein
MKGHGMPCPNGLGATGTTAMAACSGRFVRNAFTIIETSLPWVSDCPVVGTPMSRGRAHDRGLIHRRGLEGDRLAEVAHEEDLAEGGAPLGPWLIGIARSMPRNASDAPTVWLNLSGLTDSAVLRRSTSATAILPAGGDVAYGRSTPWAAKKAALPPTLTNAVPETSSCVSRHVGVTTSVANPPTPTPLHRARQSRRGSPQDAERKTDGSQMDANRAADEC